MKANIRFWNSTHSNKSLFHDRNFSYYFNDILENITLFINSPSINDISIIPKFNNNQVEMSFIISPSQLKLLIDNNFSLEKNVLFCFLPLIEFKDFKNDPNSKYKLEFWRVIDWEHIYFPPKDKSKLLEQNGSLIIYARKDIIYSNFENLKSVELFVNRSTDFVPKTENLQLCSPLCVYGNDVKKEVSKKEIKTYDKDNVDYETVFSLNTSDTFKAKEYFSKFGQFWADWVKNIQSYLPDKTFGKYWTLRTFYPSFRAHEEFGTLKYYKKTNWYYPVMTSDYNYFPFTKLSSSDGHIYYVPYKRNYFNLGLTGGSWKELWVSLLPYNYEIVKFSDEPSTTKIFKNGKTTDSNKFFFTYEQGKHYYDITHVFQHGLITYVNFTNFYKNQFIKTAKAIATAMGIQLDITQIEKTTKKTYGVKCIHSIGLSLSISVGGTPAAPTVEIYDGVYVPDRDTEPKNPEFLEIKLYKEIIYDDSSKMNVIFGNELPFKDHWDAAHIHKSLVGNRIGVFPLDRRYDYRESISGTGSNIVMVYNSDSSEIRDIGNINITQMKVDEVQSILLNIEKERERFNKLQALHNRQSIIRNSINTFSNLLEIPTIFKPNPDYWNPAPIRVDVPEEWGYEKTGWISEGMRRNARRLSTYTPYLKSAARTEWLEGAAQGLPLTFGGSFAAMGIRSVFRGAFSTVQGWINSSMERERAQLQMNLREEQALNIAVNISNDLESQFPWLNRDDIYLLEYTTGNKELIVKDRKRYGNFINEFKTFYEFGGINNGYYSVNVEHTDWAQLYNLTSTEAEIFKILMRQGIFWNPTSLNRFSETDLPQYVQRFDNE